MRIVVLLTLAGCSEYAFKPEDSDPTVPLDSDVDPIGSCVEPDAPPAGTVPVDPSCEGAAVPEIVDPWDVDIEWQWKSGGTGVIVMPAVGELTDDDGDGDIDEQDDPDLVVTLWSGGLVALDGTGVEIFSVGGYNGLAGPSIADVTGDGEPEIIALTSDSRIAAVDARGRQIWLSGYVDLYDYPQSTVADLDNDGDAEVIFDGVVLDGLTGAIQADFTRDVSTSWRTPVVADLDVDGIREIILGESVFSPDGTKLWSTPSIGAGNFAAVADIDGDAGGEVLFVSGSEMLIHDSDGTLLRSLTIYGTNPGPPCVADFDGDGEVEIAVPANTLVSLYETDGDHGWSAPMSDSSGLAGCSGYDVNGDGAYEVLFADEEALRIYDGASGDVLFEDFSHDSGTLWEYPVVADLDNDGSAEIAIASNQYRGGYLGVTVFGHHGSGWPKSGTTWPVHDFAVTNVRPDGSVPTGETPPWQLHNTFRARPAVDRPGLPDLYLETDDACVTSCGDGGVVHIPWQIGNRGGAGVESVDIVLFRLKGEDETEIGRATRSDVTPGLVPAGGVFSVSVGRMSGADAYIVRIDDDDYDDCAEGDEEIAVEWKSCP